LGDFIMAKDDEELLERKIREWEEEALERKIKASVQWNYNCSIKMFKNYVKRESTIKNVTCEKCGKTYRTNSDKSLCFSCEEKKLSRKN